VSDLKSLDTSYLRLPMQRMPRTMGVGRMARLERATPTRSDRQDSLGQGSTLFLTVKQEDFCNTVYHGLITYKETKTKCRLYWCLIEFID
jgi:hypothetical protein